MSDFSTILQRVRSNLLEAGVRFKSFASTASGAANGSTIVSITLQAGNDHFNGMVCKVITGDTVLNGLKKVVEDYATNTLTFTNNVWPKQFPSGVTCELYEPGLWDGDDLKIYIEQAANDYLRVAPDDILLNYRLAEDVGSDSGISDLPDKVLKFVEPVVEINGRPAAVISPKRALAFDDDPFIPATPGSFIAYFDSRNSTSNQIGRLKHKPATNATCTFHYVPVAEFDTSGNWQLDEGLWQPITKLATAYALMASERNDLASLWTQIASMGFPEMKDILKKRGEQQVASR